MSIAFDTVNRTTLLEDLKQILEHNELHLIKITDIGVPKGDGLSANEFTLYLSKALKAHNHLFGQFQSTIMEINYLDNCEKQRYP